MELYHVVTERPMTLGQTIVFDGTHESGVLRRVRAKEAEVREIYRHPERYDAETLEHHTRVALRELALERVRREAFPDLPSRLACLYASGTLAEAEKWAELFLAWGRPTFAIVRLETAGPVFLGDAQNCFDAVTDEAENLALARRYWENLPNLRGKPPIPEWLVGGTIRVAEIVKEIAAG